MASLPLAVLRELRKDWNPVFNRTGTKSWQEFLQRLDKHIRRAPCKLQPLTAEGLREAMLGALEAAVAVGIPVPLLQAYVQLLECIAGETG